VVCRTFRDGSNEAGKRNRAKSVRPEKTCAYFQKLLERKKSWVYLDAYKRIITGGVWTGKESPVEGHHAKNDYAGRVNDQRRTIYKKGDQRNGFLVRERQKGKNDSGNLKKKKKKKAVATM